MAAAVVLSTVGAVASADAAPIDGEDDAKTWAAASAADKDRWIATAVDSMNRRSTYQYTRDDLRACLNDFFKRPLSKEAGEKTIGQAALGCMATIRERKP